MGSTAAPARTLVRTTDDDEEDDGVAGSTNSNNNANYGLEHHQHHHTPTISNVPSLVCAFSAAATTGGTSYAFGLYSAALKHNLHLTQDELDSISTAFFVAGLFSFIPGLCSDRFGTRFALSLGGCTGAASLLSYWAVAREFVVPPHRTALVPLLSALGVATFMSCALVTGAVFKIIVSSTGPGTKGSAVGAAKGYVGLGAGLYACLFQTVRAAEESDLDFLPMAAFFFVACATLPALILLPSKSQLESHVYRDECTPRHIRTLYGSLVTMAILIVANSMLNLYESTSSPSAHHNANQSTQPSLGKGLMLLSIWLAPICYLYCLPRKRHVHNDGVIALPDSADNSYRDDAALQTELQQRQWSFDGRPVMSTTTSSAAQSKTLAAKIAAPPTTIAVPSLPYQDEKRGLLVSNSSSAVVEAEALVANEKNVDNGALAGLDDDVDDDDDDDDEDGEVEINLNMIQMLQTPTAWFMLWTVVILVGGGTVETNNMGQMVESLGFRPSVTSASLALFSVAQATTRVLTGSLSEAALGYSTRRFGIDNGVPRPFFLVVASLVGFLAHLALGFAQSQLMFVAGAALAGAAFGMVWPLMVLISAEVFGVAGHGQNYMFYDGVSSAAGTLLLTKLIAQKVYDVNTDPRGADPKTCIGMGCFQSTHLIVAGLSLTCVISSSAMLYTSRHIYNKTSIHVA